MASQESSKMQEEGSGRQVPEGPIHCLNNCGFFGSAATMNFCSKCYREINAKQPSFSSHLKPQQPALEQLNAKHPSMPLSAPPLPLSGDVPMVEAVAAVETAASPFSRPIPSSKPLKSIRFETLLNPLLSFLLYYYYRENPWWP
uniref:A20-type domain-containing protein n=1 Tax=Picea sitchensis TaxID=3332 RepID=B8LRP0_PICSI|nr:unknown [Picea sitchensis]